MHKYHEFFPAESAEYVVLHAHYRASRGKKPSSSFNGIADPRKALIAARKVIETDPRIWPPFPRDMSEPAILRVIELLGHRLCTKDELNKILGKTVVLGALPPCAYIIEAFPPHIQRKLLRKKKRQERKTTQRSIRSFAA